MIDSVSGSPKRQLNPSTRGPGAGASGRSSGQKTLRGRHAGGSHDLLGEELRAFDLSGGSARPEHGDASVAKLVGQACHEGRFRSDDDEVDFMLAAEREQSLAVLRPDRMAMANPGDPRVSRRSMQLFAVLALGQLPGERVLAPARPHDQNLHGRSVSKGSYVRILFLWPIPVSIAAIGRLSGEVSSLCSSIRRPKPCPRWTA